MVTHARPAEPPRLTEDEYGVLYRRLLSRAAWASGERGALDALTPARALAATRAVRTGRTVTQEPSHTRPPDESTLRREGNGPARSAAALRPGTSHGRATSGPKPPVHTTGTSRCRPAQCRRTGRAGSAPPPLLARYPARRARGDRPMGGWDSSPRRTDDVSGGLPGLANPLTDHHPGGKTSHRVGRDAEYFSSLDGGVMNRHHPQFPPRSQRAIDVDTRLVKTGAVFTAAGAVGACVGSMEQGLLPRGFGITGVRSGRAVGR